MFDWIAALTIGRSLLRQMPYSFSPHYFACWGRQKYERWRKKGKREREREVYLSVCISLCKVCVILLLSISSSFSFFSSPFLYPSFSLLLSFLPSLAYKQGLITKEVCMSAFGSDDGINIAREITRHWVIDWQGQLKVAYCDSSCWCATVSFSLRNKVSLMSHTLNRFYKSLSLSLLPLSFSISHWRCLTQPSRKEVQLPFD